MQELEDINKVDLYMKYVGAVSLLGEISSNENTSDQMVLRIERAINDAVDMVPDRLEKIKTAGGGFSLEPKRGQK